MTIERLREAVEAGNDFYFDYNDKRAGVEFTVEDSIFTFEMWHGEKFQEGYHQLDEVINDPFFDGKTIKELLENDEIEIDFF